jgi:uncharacterized protein involved in exopolysaccharide biosynthesis
MVRFVFWTLKCWALCICLLSLANCRDQVAELTTQVEQVHDEAMRDISPLNALDRSIRARLTQMDSTTAEYAQMRKVQYQIYQADEDMKAWMANYNPPDLKDPAAVRYLTAELEKIRKNQADIKAAIEAGKLLMKD